MPRSIFLAVMLATLASGSVVGQDAHDFPVTPADLAQVRLQPDSSAVREVLYDGLEVRTRPIPEAAILTRLEKGARVGLVSEGGGWSTMDMGGGFLGWIVTAGLGDVSPPSVIRPRSVPVVAPVPPPRPRSVTGASPITVVEDASDEPTSTVKRF